MGAAGLVRELWRMDSKVKSPTWWQQENVLPCATVKLQLVLRLRKQLKASASSVSFNKWYQRNCWMTWSRSTLCFKPVNQWNCACYSPCAWACTCSPTCKTPASQKVRLWYWEQVQVLKAATSCSSIVAPCSTTILRSKKSPTWPTERTPKKPEYLITRAT